MKKTFILLITLFCIFSVQAQTLSKEWHIVKPDSEIPFIGIEFFKPENKIQEGKWAAEGQLFNKIIDGAYDEFATFTWMISKGQLVLYISFSANDNFKKEEYITLPFNFDENDNLQLKWKGKWYSFK